MKYKKHYEDINGWTEWIQPERTGYKLGCCDCGLVHTLNFRVKKGKIQYKASRDERATGQKRRHMPTKIVEK